MKKTSAEIEQERLGFRRANHAALYANVRMMLARTLLDEDPPLLEELALEAVPANTEVS